MAPVQRAESLAMQSRREKKSEFPVTQGVQSYQLNKN